jgi:hypothetical protein
MHIVMLRDIDANELGKPFTRALMKIWLGKAQPPARDVNN